MIAFAATQVYSFKPNVLCERTLYLSISIKSKDMIPTILAIAGSDPTGGAGIQADLKTTTAIGVYGAAAITCITVQNSLGVSRVEPLSPDLIEQQITSVLSDHFVSHIKIGMVGTLTIAKTIGKILNSFQGETVYDPVLVSSSGQELFEPVSLGKLKSELIAKVTILTPNLPELSALTGKEILNEKQAISATKILLQHFDNIKAIIIKGGHAPRTDKIKDFIVYRQNNKIETKSITHSRIQSTNIHGTGCTFSTAFASFHSLSGDIDQAFHDSIAFMDTIIKKSADKHVIRSAGRNGPLLHFIWRN